MDDSVTERDKETSGHRESPGPQISPALVRDSVIVFDWDDTILPTSWLDKIRALTAGVPLRPEVQRQMAALCSVCATTMAMAQQMGTVIFITNSAPGWLDQSCQLFMPQIYQQCCAIPKYAKPMHAPLTFKLSAFRRECQQFRNLVSVGDGDSERAASLRLLAPPDRKSLPDANKCVKSVKLIEFPSCQQLIAEHEMLQVRLLDIVKFQGSLDLKSRFAGPVGYGGGSGQGKASGCTLVHFPRSPGASQMSPQPRAAQSAGAPRRPPIQEDGGTSASRQAAGMLMMRLPPGLRPPGNGLPPLSGPGSPVGGRSGCDTAPSSPVDHSPGLFNSPARASGSSDLQRFERASHGSSGPVDFLSGSGEAGNSANSGGPGSSSQDRVGTWSHPGGPSLSSTEELPGGTWRMQGMGGHDPRGSRSQYNTPTKKRPVLGSSPGRALSALRGGRASGGAVWREGSAPAATRGSNSIV